MTYRVVFQPNARRETEKAYAWIAERSPEAAARWLDGIEAAVLSLAEFPERCPLAPEDAYFAEEIRQLVHGKRAHRYRILFTVHGDTVRILHVRHAARRPLGEGEI